MTEAETRSDPFLFDQIEGQWVVDAEIDENIEWLQSSHNPISTLECGAFTEKVQRFNGQARRMRDIFWNGQSALVSLTFLFNRQAIMTVLACERGRTLCTGAAWCILLTDIDHSKSVNDTNGYAGAVLYASKYGGWNPSQACYEVSVR